MKSRSHIEVTHHIVLMTVLTASFGIVTPGLAFANPQLAEIRSEVRAGNARRAEELAQELVEAEPDNAEAHNTYGEVLTVRIDQVNFFRKPGIARRMRNAWGRTIELNPEHVDAHRSLMQYYLHAPAIAGGSRETALTLARQIVAIDPAAGHHAMADYWTADDNLEKAAAEYSAAIEAYPENDDLWYAYGLHLQGIGDWDAAYESFMNILARNPGDLRAHYQIGRNAVMSRGRLDEGAASLEWYLLQELGDGGESHAWASTRLGQIYLHMGRTEDARAQFESALALDPGHDEAKSQLAALE